MQNEEAYYCNEKSELDFCFALLLHYNLHEIFVLKTLHNEANKITQNCSPKYFKIGERFCFNYH